MRASYERNVRRFILFRILFNARFYYPVFAILFLDLGLSASQFALANTLWAISIVVLEVPSGAMADLFGRRKLLIMASALMVVEMALLIAAPLFGTAFLLVCIFLNRVLSGAAEAAASGADEALAYDSLAALGREAEWPLLLEKLVRWQSIAFVCSSLLGALAYDAAVLNSLGSLLGMDWGLSSELTRRLPIVLTLLSGLLVFYISLGFVDAQHQASANEPSHGAWMQMRTAFQWLLSSPFALALIACALCFDSVVRIILTFTSSYYRLIELPEASFGLWGSAFAAIGFLSARLGRSVTQTMSAGSALSLVAVLILCGLVGIALGVAHWGVVFMIPLGVGFFLMNFVVSYHLNRTVDSRQRATVLSFKGLALNLAYGGLGAAFAGVLTLHRKPDATDSANAAFAGALPWLVLCFLASLGVLFLFARKRLSRQ